MDFWEILSKKLERALFLLKVARMECSSCTAGLICRACIIASEAGRKGVKEVRENGERTSERANKRASEQAVSLPTSGRPLPAPARGSLYFCESPAFPLPAIRSMLIARCGQNNKSSSYIFFMHLRVLLFLLLARSPATSDASNTHYFPPTQLGRYKYFTGKFYGICIRYYDYWLVYLSDLRRNDYRVFKRLELLPRATAIMARQKKITKTRLSSSN